MNEGGLAVHGRTEWIRNTADTVGGKCGTLGERLESGEGVSFVPVLGLGKSSVYAQAFECTFRGWHVCSGLIMPEYIPRRGNMPHANRPFSVPFHQHERIFTTFFNF